MINDARIFERLSNSRPPDAARTRDILAKARALKGLEEGEIAALMHISDPDGLAALFETARCVKDDIYGRRIVIFAPLYISNLCANECQYCAFRATNKAINRRALTQDEIRDETRHVLSQGHKRVLLVAGESYPREGFAYVERAIASIYGVTHQGDQIRRINVNIAPLDIDEFRALRAAKIGTYQLFQETYHRPTYAAVHPRGKKSDYDWRVGTMDRAMEAGIDDIGIGVLFGLFDWRYELLALAQHIAHLEHKFACGPHTISVPRLEPASGSDIAAHPPHPVSDIDFRKIIAILRISVPYTGIIMSTRETAAIRRETFALGVSQISAGSRTSVGGYATGDKDVFDAAQFSLGDHRPLDEVIQDLATLGFVPSFCTACYRLGRTGVDFMDQAKPGLIKNHCEPNALSTFMEYLTHYGSPASRAKGRALIERIVSEMPDENQDRTRRALTLIEDGQRDVIY